MRSLPSDPCAVCGRRLYLSKSVPGGRLYYCPKGHPTATGKARPEVRLILGKVTRRQRMRHWLKGL